MEIAKLTVDNYSYTVLRFRERQAGVSAIYNPAHMSYTYNAYCLETKLLQDLFTCEYDFLEDAIFAINEEFGSWEIEDLSDQKGCGSCAAKKLN